MRKIYSLLLLTAALICLPMGVKGAQINEGFEDTSFPPEGWSAIHVSGSESWQRYSSQYSSVGYNSSACAQMKWASAGHENYLITPQLKPEAEESLTFYVKKDYSGTNLVVEVSTTTNEKSAFSELSTITDANISSTWAQKSVDLSAYVGQDIYIAFHVIDNNGSSINIDDVAGVTLKPESCPKTSAPEASNIGATTATISWTENGTAEAWNLQYKKSSDEEWTSVNGLTSTTYELTGLSASTTYNFQVQAVCSQEDQSDWKAGSDFPTSCVAEPITWEYNFDGMTNNQTQLNICAVRYGSNYYPCAVTGVKKSGSASYYFYGGQSDNEQLLVLPEFTEELKDLKVRFFYQSNSSTYSKTISAGYVTDPNNKSTYVPKTTLENGKDAWTEVVCTYDEAPAGARFAIYFKGTNSGSNKQGKLWIDEFTVSSAIDCSQPQDVTISGITGEGAHVAWTALEGVTTYRYCVVAHGDAADWSGNLTVNTNAVDLTGLTDGTEYDFYVQGKCTGENWTEASAAATFTPSACPTVTSVSLTTPLYNGVTVNWTSNGTGATYDVRYKVVDVEGWTVCAEEVEGNSKAITGLVANTGYIIAVKPHCSEAWLAAEDTYTPIYTLPGVPAITAITSSGANVSWDAATGGATGYEYVWMEGAAAADWTSPTATESTSATLSELTDGKQYTFYVRATFGEAKGEAVSQTFNTATIAPAISNEYTATANLITFSWTYEGSATLFQVSQNGTDWSVAQAEKEATINELTSGTSYTLYVRAYYSESVQSAGVSKAFQTECATVAIGWSENFGTVTGAKPNCWTIANWGTSANSWTTAGDYAKTGVALRYNARTMSSSDAITPSIEITDKCQLTFYIRNSVGSYSAKVECKVLVNDGNETTEIAHITTRYTTATLQTLDLSAYKGKTVTIIFRGMGYDTSGSPYLWIDDVAVTYKPVAAPTNLTATPANASAVVTWERAEADAKDSLRYRVNGSEDKWTKVANIEGKTYTIESLINGTTYEVQVKTVASTNRQSAWTASQTFTPVDCPSVETVTFGAKTYNSVVVNWTATAAATWNLRYKAEGDENWTPVVGTISEQTYTLTELTTNTAYTIAVKPSCNDAEEAWVAAAETVTLVYTAPATAAVANATDTNAVATWAAVADATGYEYIVVEKDAAVNWESARAVNEATVELKNLQGLTDYDFYVRATYPASGASAATKATFATIGYAPKNLTAGEITTTTATFTWEANGAAVKYQWSTDNTNWSDAQTELNATATGLNAGTSYTFYVRSYYAEGKYSAAINLPFNTECDIEQIGYTQDFEAGGKPLCWEVAEENWAETFSQSSTGNKWSNRYGSTTHQGNYALYYNSKTSTANSADITMPRIAIDKAAKLLFYIKNNYEVTGEVRIAADEIETQVVALKTTSNNFNTLQEIELAENFIGKTVTITFHAQGAGTSENSSSLAIDDIEIAQVCQKPTNLAATATSDGAEVTWEGEEDQYQYCVVNAGNDPAGWVLLESGEKSVTITGKQVGKSYDVYVRAYCGAANQSAAVMTTFVPAETPSGFGNTNADGKKAVKLIENDQMIIIRDGVKYNAQGQKLQ